MEWVTEQTMLAKDERKRQIELNCKTEENLINKNQFRDKLFKHLSNLYINEVPNVQLYSAIGKYYQDNGKSPPFAKLMDIVLDFKVCQGWLTFEEHFYMFHSS